MSESVRIYFTADGRHVLFFVASVQGKGGRKMDEIYHRGMLSVKELAAYLGVSVSIAYRLANSTGFPVLRLGKRLLVPVEELRAWIARQTNSGC